ncbi:MAG: trypsin-like serine protease [Acidimicrobiales bacterium]
MRTLVVAALMTTATQVAQTTPTAALLTPTIQPGARHVLSCTLSFVYDGLDAQAGRVFIGTAAHCVTQVGQDVALLASPLEPFGDVAVIGAFLDAATDWALIEVRPEFVSRVSPALVNHPQYPTGSTTSDGTSAGDLVQLNDLLFIPRQVALSYDDAEIYRVTGTLTSPPSVVPSDSGGPLVHVPSGAALGIVSQGLNCALPALVCEEYQGPTVQGIMAKAAAAGFPVTLRTV